MPPTTLQRLGFSPDDRVVILHADDIGMCHATIPAFENLLEFGLTSSYAIMAPCPWASAALEVAAKANADVGVHITLTSEWKQYRWRPLSTLETASGLLDAEGFFPRKSPDVRASAVPEAARKEMQSQFKFFADRGVEPTHMDSHMLSSLHARLLKEYVGTALEQNTPALFPSSGGSGLWMDEATLALALELEPSLLALGFPTVDHFDGTPLSSEPDSRDDVFEVRLETTQQILHDLKPGLTHFAFHPSVDTPELRSICPDWRSRVGDEAVFRSPELRRAIRELGIKVFGYRELKNLLHK